MSETAFTNRNDAGWFGRSHASLGRVGGDSGHQSTRICELPRHLAYRDVQTRMLLGQWAANLAGLERRLLNELDQQTGRASTPPANEFGRQEKLNQPSQVGRAQASTLTEEPFSVEGFPV